VYVDKYSNISLIIELLATDESIPHDVLLTHYFDDIASCNEAHSSNILKKVAIISLACNYINLSHMMSRKV
jgi:hypothetical protein